VARAHDRRDPRERRRRGHDALADQRVPLREGQLVAIERASLAENRLGHGGLADVVQLCGDPRAGDVLVREPETGRRGRGEAGHVDGLRCELVPLLGDQLQECGSNLAALVHPARALVGVHPLVGELERALEIRRLAVAFQLLAGRWTTSLTDNSSYVEFTM
jgi:hypothetical protein